MFTVQFKLGLKPFMVRFDPVCRIGKPDRIIRTYNNIIRAIEALAAKVAGKRGLSKGKSILSLMVAQTVMLYRALTVMKFKSFHEKQYIYLAMVIHQFKPLLTKVKE